MYFVFARSQFERRGSQRRSRPSYGSKSCFAGRFKESHSCHSELVRGRRNTSNKPCDNPLRQKWTNENAFVVGYSGNLGRAHEIDTLLAAAERLKSNSRIIFIFIGGGYLRERLSQSVQERGLRNFRFFDYQDKINLKFSLSAADVHWISLRPEVEGLIVPSKIYGIAAAGRPVIAICAKDGEIAQMVQQHQCGVVVEPGDTDALVAAIIHLSTDSESRSAMGRNARTMLESHFTRRQALEHWRSLLEHVSRGG